jgi:hypothetical protein
MLWICRIVRAGNEIWMMKPFKAAGVVAGNLPVLFSPMPARRQTARRMMLAMSYPVIGQSMNNLEKAVHHKATKDTKLHKE